MKKIKLIKAKTSNELAKVLNLSPEDLGEIEIRVQINDKIIETIKKLGLTHSEVAKLAKTSRSRVTAILNRNTQNVSTDLLFRILGVLGYKPKITFLKTKMAA